MQKTTLGNFELIAINDGGYFLDGGAMFGVVPKTLWSRKAEPDALNRIRLGLNTVIVRTGDHTVVIETGIGNKLPDKSRKIYENVPQLMDQFEQAGVDPAEVDIVINTHLHFDHCGWNTTRRADGSVVPDVFRMRNTTTSGWNSSAPTNSMNANRVSYMTDNYDPLVANGQAVILDGDREIAPGISVRPLSGDTRARTRRCCSNPTESAPATSAT
jgi:glyoxylase-like metal-dependent hydrolase (beta-lactamase superfamily II)